MSEGTIAMGAILDFVTRYGPEFLIGLGYTLYISMLGSAIGIAIGFVVALLRGLPIPPLQWLCRAYVEVLLERAATVGGRITLGERAGEEPSKAPEWLRVWVEGKASK